MTTGNVPPKSDLSPAIAGPPQPFDDPVVDELSRKMKAWSEAWFGSESGDTASKHSQVRERLLFWLRRCLGPQASSVLAKEADDLSLAKSSPLLTAFLGRRAMVELSRRVLEDE